MRLLQLSLLCASLFLAEAHAQVRTPSADLPQATDPNAWSVRTYRFPLEQLPKTLGPKEQALPQVPDLPSSDAGDRESMAFLKESTKTMGALLSAKGLVLPQGTLLAYDRANKTLAVRTNLVTHRLIVRLADILCYSNGYDGVFNLCIIEAEADVIRAAVNDAATQADHTFILSRLEALADQGQAKRISTMDLVAGRGKPVRMVREDRPLNDTIPRTIAKPDTVLDLDCNINPDAESMDVTYALNHHMVKIESGITVGIDSTKLLGVWATEGLSGTVPPRALQAAFLKAGISPRLPEVSHRVEALLKTYGETIEPTPTRPEPTQDPLPPGMILRRYLVPRDFLASCCPSKDGPDTLTLWILKTQGIEFPEGSFAKFHDAGGTGELIVGNTAENHETVALYVESIQYKFPQFLSHTLQVVQVDAAFLRKLESETQGIEDHIAAWRAVESEVALGRAQILSTVWSESRSGQRASVSAGAASPLLAGSAKEPTDVKEMNRVGTVFEVDPMIEPDGERIDLILTLNYDYSPPTLRQKPEADVEKTPGTDTLIADFHKATLTTKITLKDGATRLVGVWKPETLTGDQNKDVLQAAFIRVKLLNFERETKE